MPSKNAVNIVNKSCSQCDVIRMFPISFRISLRLYGTYHRITPWLIGFIVGYFLHKYQHFATFQKLEELRNRRVTWRKVRAICTPLTNCQCHRAACLASQHKKMRFFEQQMRDRHTIKCSLLRHKICETLQNIKIL